MIVSINTSLAEAITQEGETCDDSREQKRKTNGEMLKSGPQRELDLRNIFMQWETNVW